MNQGEQNREKRDTKPGGVFDKGTANPNENANKDANAAEENIGLAMNVKENFKEPSVEDVQKKAAIRKQPSKSEKYQDDQANAINKAMAGEDLYDDIEVDEKDLALAEKLIFDGFAETDVSMPNFSDRTFTICSTSAEELSIMDEVLFDMIKKHETVDSKIDLPQNHINSLRSALFLALGYRGMNKKELCPAASNQLNTIKKAVQRLTEQELAGNLDEAEKLRESLKHSLKTRGLMIKRLPTSLIDWLSGKKAEFDRKMYKVMSTKNIIPKS